jgi:hypothetical protein
LGFLPRTTVTGASERKEPSGNVMHIIVADEIAPQSLVDEKKSGIVSEGFQ